MRLSAFIVLLVLLLVGSVAIVVVREASAAVESNSESTHLREDPDAIGQELGWASTAAPDDPALKTVLVSIDGRNVSRKTTAATVKDLLIQLDVVLDADHAISHDLDAEVVDGTRIVVARIDVEAATEETDIPFETTEIQDASLAEGVSVVQTTGRLGTATTSYLVRYADGIEVLRTEVLSKVHQEPRTEVIRVGTGAPDGVPASQAPAASLPQQPPAVQPAPQPTVDSLPGSSSATEAEAKPSTPNSPATKPPAPKPTKPSTQQPAPKPTPKPTAEPSAPSTQEPNVGAGVGPGTTPASARQLARSMAAARGWNASEATCLDSLWHRESSWNFKAKNPYSTARGIPQAMMSIHFGADWRSSAAALAYLQTPRIQIEWGLNYIQRHRNFSTPCGALEFWQENNWY